MIRPFRLINSVELHDLHQHFNKVIAEWLDKYALNSITSTLEIPPPEHPLTQGYSITEENKTLGMIEQSYIAWGNQVIFGKQLSCFNQTTTELLRLLISDLVKMSTCNINEDIKDTPLWFYRGSTGLKLTLNCNQKRLVMILSPEWVYQQLVKNKLTHGHLGSLDKALEKHTLNVELTLAPITLSLKQLLAIQIGDVLTTDHSIHTPLSLVREKQILAKADLGQTTTYKSIFLERSS